MSIISDNRGKDIGIKNAVSYLEEYAVKKLTAQDNCEAQEWNSDITSDIDYLIPFDCLAREIQDWIIETSVKPQPALAFSSVISILSVVMGRRLQVQGIKGNFMSLCLAESGEGKDWPLKASQKILTAIGLGNDINSDMASGAALVDALSESPSLLMQIDEAGHYFASINNKNSNQFSKEIMPIITKLYTSSADQYIGKKCKGTDAKKIIEPNLVVFGLSTERQIMESLRTSEVADGSLARFMVIFGHGDVPINQNRKSNAIVPGIILSRLELLKSGNFFNKSTEIILTDDYARAKNDMEIRFNDLAIKIGKSMGDKAMFKPFYYRLSVRALQIAMLIDHCKDIKILLWAEQIVEQSCNVFIKKFCHLASDNDNEKFVKIIERAIKESGKNGITKEKFYDKTRTVGAREKKNILDDMMESNKIFMSRELRRGAKIPTTIYFWRK